MKLTAAARKAVRRFGIDVRRWRPESEANVRVAQLIQSQDVSLVLDVGANRGQYGRALRCHGYHNEIISFEPLDEAFSELAELAARDSRWEASQVAIGAVEGEVVLNVAANGGASSSILPMLSSHLEAAPESRYIGQRSVALRRLDDILSTSNQSSHDRIFLKIDVQGYEGQVLDGAKELLGSPGLVGMQIEVSFAPLYEGGLGWREAFQRATELGMAPFMLEPIFFDPTGRILQADCTFFRE